MMPLHQSLAKDYEAIAQIGVTLQFSFWALFFAPKRVDFSLKSSDLTSCRRLSCLFYVPFATFRHNRAQ